MTDKTEQLMRMFRKKMEEAQINNILIDNFAKYYNQVVAGATGTILEDDITPITPTELVGYESLANYQQRGAAALNQAVMIKLNGGLGTSMGLNQPKSLINVKDGLCFLDIVSKRLQTYNLTHSCDIPLILMNSFFTDAATAEYVRHMPTTALALSSFVQHKFPRIVQETLMPFNCSENPTLEWSPPGHGDLYTALLTTGLLDKLLAANKRYAFISNIDNLGGFINTCLLGYFVDHQAPFMMEVANRTEMDRKGGHLARERAAQRLILREIAQCRQAHIGFFQDIERYRYFNTNNIWLDLKQLKSLIVGNDNILGLPMIRNAKTINCQGRSENVYQIETAIGSAISLFDSALAIIIPRKRFAPVKKSEDLLLLWSDYYVLADDFSIMLNPKRAFDSVNLVLDARYYGSIKQLQARCAKGVPSLVACKSLQIDGDVAFAENVSICGEVVIRNLSASQVTIPNGSLIKQDITFS